MHKRNDGKGEDNIAQNRFTAYLLVALKNTKKNYMRKKYMVQSHEIPLDAQDNSRWFIYEPDMLSTISAIDQLEDARLAIALRRIGERDLYIFISRILGGKSLRELSEELGIRYYTVSTIYSRVLNRIRRELKDDG